MKRQRHSAVKFRAATTHNKAIALTKEFAVAYGNANVALNALYMEHAIASRDVVGYHAAAGSVACDAMKFVTDFTSNLLQQEEDFRKEHFLTVGHLLVAIGESKEES